MIPTASCFDRSHVQHTLWNRLARTVKAWIRWYDIARCGRSQAEQVEPPCRKVEVETPSEHVVAIPDVARRPQQVAEFARPARQLREGQADIALTLGGLEVHDAQKALAGAVPGERDETVPRRVALPGFVWLQQQ